MNTTLDGRGTSPSEPLFLTPVQPKGFKDKIGFSLAIGRLLKGFRRRIELSSEAGAFARPNTS
jgi:hypothetical protein